MGEIIARNMLSLLELLINRYCCNLLVVYIIYINDARLYKHQISLLSLFFVFLPLLSQYTESSKKMDGIWNGYNLKSTRRIYTFGVLKCSEKFKVLDLCKLIILN